MGQPYSSGGSRQAAVLTAIVGFHFGMFLLIAAGLGPRLIDALRNPNPPPVELLPPEERPLELAVPGDPRPLEVFVIPVPNPYVVIPVIEADDVTEPSQDSVIREDGATGTLPAASASDPPRLMDRSNRLAALIDSCYPAASRRAGEEGRVVVRLLVDRSGRAASWRVTESSGVPRLDAAVSCIIQRLEFTPGRRDGRAVQVESQLPIVFRLR